MVGVIILFISLYIIDALLFVSLALILSFSINELNGFCPVGFIVQD